MYVMCFVCSISCWQSSATQDFLSRRLKRTVGLEDTENLVSCNFCQPATPFPMRGSFVHIPVTILTWATPWESRRTTPICEGVAPFFASLQIWSTTWSGVVLSHAGAERE